MDHDDDRLIEEMKEVLIKGINPQQIYLFGSRARGGSHRDSDLDLLVVVDQVFGKSVNRHAEIRRIRRLLSSFRVPKDILVYGREEVKRWGSARNHIVAHCLKEGKLLYERP